MVVVVGGSSVSWQNTRASEWLCQTDRSFLLFPSNGRKPSPWKVALLGKTELCLFVQERPAGEGLGSPAASEPAEQTSRGSSAFC